MLTVPFLTELDSRAARCYGLSSGPRKKHSSGHISSTGDCKTELPGQRRLPEVFYDPRSLELDSVKRSSIHAKCIVIDRKLAFVSSANFTEAAQVRNIEVGALIHSERFAVRLDERFEVLAKAGLLCRIPVS